MNTNNERKLFLKCSTSHSHLLDLQFFIDMLMRKNYRLRLQYIETTIFDAIFFMCFKNIRLPVSIFTRTSSDLFCVLFLENS